VAGPGRIENLKPFKPGPDPRRGVKPKGAIHLSTRIQNMLNDPDFEQKLKDGSVIKGAPIEAIIKVAIAKAMSGDVRLMEWLAKHGYGTNINVSGDSENPIQMLLRSYGIDPTKISEGELDDGQNDGAIPEAPPSET